MFGVFSSCYRKTNITVPKKVYDVSNQDNNCVICMVSPKDVIYVPCGHYSSCHSCSLDLLKHSYRSCPICRKKIKYISNVSSVELSVFVEDY
jgi:hypothetical protein